MVRVWSIKSSRYAAVSLKVNVDTRLLDILACPLCKGPLRYHKAKAVLVCRADRLAFPIRDDIPVLLEEEAASLAAGDALLED